MIITVLQFRETFEVWASQGVAKEMPSLLIGVGKTEAEALTAARKDLAEGLNQALAFTRRCDQGETCVTG